MLFLWYTGIDSFLRSYLGNRKTQSNRKFWRIFFNPKKSKTKSKKKIQTIFLKKMKKKQNPKIAKNGQQIPKSQNLRKTLKKSV